MDDNEDMETTTNEIIVERLTLQAVPGHYFGGRGGGLVATKWTYRCDGPDGTHFTNDSIVTLRSVLKRKYGKTVTVVEPWKVK